MRDGALEAGAAEATVDVGGVAVHLRRTGAGAPTVLIHGASGNLRDWAVGPMAAVAARREAIAFDRPGHGLSGWPGPVGVRLCEQARLMRLALAAVGVRRATLVGHSFGGSIALAWALDAPESVDGLVLLCPPSQPWRGGLPALTELLAAPVVGPVLSRALPALLPRSVAEAAAAKAFAPQTPPPGYIETLRYELVARPSTLRRNALQLDALKDQLRVMAPRYPCIAAPVEILHGEADGTVPLAVHSEPLARQIPGARLTRLPGVGHMPHHVALPELIAALGRLAAAAAG